PRRPRQSRLGDLSIQYRLSRTGERGRRPSSPTGDNRPIWVGVPRPAPSAGPSREWAGKGKRKWGVWWARPKVYTPAADAQIALQATGFLPPARRILSNGRRWCFPRGAQDRGKPVHPRSRLANLPARPDRSPQPLADAALSAHPHSTQNAAPRRVPG